MLQDATIYREQHRGGNVMPAPDAQGAMWCATMHGQGPVVFPPDAAVSDRVAVVRVERGMWVVDCPCRGAQMACRTDHRVFCPDCQNQHSDQGYWVRVQWPSDWQMVEDALAPRPRYNQNWNPGEDLSGLWLENLANGWVSA